MIRAAALAGAIALLLPLAAQAGDGGAAPEPALDSDEQKTLYALGVLVGRNLETFHLSPAELETVRAGLTETVQGKKSRVEMDTWGPRVKALGAQRNARYTADEKQRGLAYAEAAAREPGAIRSRSGLVFRSLHDGDGARPSGSDTVRVSYRGTRLDGSEFDSSYKRGKPAEFPLKGVIACWTEGLQLMKVGGRARLVCPSGIAYGDQGRPPGIAGGATLTFEVELVAIVPPAPKP